MAITYNIKQDARGYDPRGVTDWGLASRHLDSLVNVTLGTQFQSSKGLMVHITAPPWDNGRDFTVRMADIVQVVVEDPPPTTPEITGIYPPGSIEIKLIQPDGRILIGRNDETDTYTFTFME